MNALGSSYGRNIWKQKSHRAPSGSPNNPTGAVYSNAELTGLAEVLRRHAQVYVLSDDIYEKLVYDVTFSTMADAAPGLHCHVPGSGFMASTLYPHFLRLFRQGARKRLRANSGSLRNPFRER